MAEFEERPRLSIGEEEAPPYPLEKLTGGRRRTRAQIHALHQQAGRVPPQAVELEQAVLGAMLIEPEAIPRALEILTPEAFYDGRHQRIFRAIIRLFEQNRGVDLLTVTEELRRTGELEQAGDTIYLSELTTRVASAANVEYHARIIAEKALLRRMIEVMTLLVGRAYDPAADAFELLDEVEAEIFRLSDVHLRKAARSMNEVVKETLERLEAIHGRPGGITGVPSGFHQLDALTGGWQRGDLIIIAARPSMGKTAFALSCARNAALHPHYGTGVAIFSLEMGAEQLAQRLLTAEARVDAQAARTGRLRDEDWRKLARAAGRLSDAPIFIDDTPSLGVLELRAKCRRLKAEHDIGLVIVDYLQLMQASHMPRNANREQEIAQISRSLKALAKELNVPVVALSQLSRAVETRGGDKRPQLSDLRESGCLAGDTLITLADGRHVPIRELVGQQNFSVWALNPRTYRLERARVSRAFCTGIKPVYRLTTQLGRSIRATANHRFLTPQGWKRVDELQPGDYLALPRRIPTASTSTLTEAELALLGHLIGDGCTLPHHAIQYTSRDADLATLVAHLAIKVFGSEVTPQIRKELRWYQVYLRAARPLAPGKRNPISDWLRNLGIFGLRSYEKKVPALLFCQTSEAIATFLRHLWATDGCMQMRRGKKPYPAVYYATSSYQLARDVQSLLLRLGINARLKTVAQGEKGRVQYHVKVSGREDLLRFVEKIGAVGARQRAALASVYDYLSVRKGNPNRDIIPVALWYELVREAMYQRGISHRQLHANLGMAYGGMTLFRQNLSRARALRLAEAAACPELRQLAQSDVYWDPIVSIEPDGVEEVFDLTVPGPHNFVANDIIAHNSIEQDADVVLFIYRPERYGITVDENGNSTEGIAEIIIGKQRNGPTGTVRLAFINQYARFENLTMYQPEPGTPLPETPDETILPSGPPDEAPF